MYDENNVFAKIIRREIPADIIYEDEHTIGFKDISPAAPIHIIVIPKNKYTSFHHFMEVASENETTNFFVAIKKIASNLNIDQNGYRILSNIGSDGMQTVPHFHFHILAGKPLGRIVGR